MGHNEDPGSEVLGANRLSRKNVDPRFVAESVQVQEHGIKATVNVSKHVLAQDPGGANFSNEAAEFRP